MNLLMTGSEVANTRDSLLAAAAAAAAGTPILLESTSLESVLLA